MKKQKQQLAFFEGGEKAKQSEIIKGATLTSEAERLLGNFEALAEAPDGVKKLRELVLGLAVRGKLVPQDPADELAATLQVKIRAERKRLVAAKVVRHHDESPPPIEEEIPFEVPSSWLWTRFGEVGDWGAGATPSRSNSRYYGGTMPWFKSGELNDGYIDAAEENITELALKECSLRRNVPGDVLIAMYGATIGKVAILRTAATTNQAVCACTCFPGIYNEYLLRALKAFRRNFVAQGAGGAQPNISKVKIVNTPLPLPPLAEQARIVAKVDELMALCDEMEARQAKRRVAAGRLNKAALGELTSAQGPEELASSLRRVVGNFEALADKPESVGELRRTIVALAVRGYLVDQHTANEPAERMRDRLATQHSNRDAAQDEQALASPFKLPAGWCWARLPQLGHFGRGKSKHRPRNDPALFTNGRYPMIQTGDVARANGPIMTRSSMYNEAGLAQSRLWPKGTLCITIAANIADTGILGFDACFPDSVVGFVPDPELGSARYFELFLQTAKSNIEDFAPATAQKNINLEILSAVLIPLPPKEEMNRIVAKVDHLMALCDTLEAKLRAADEGARRLAESLVAELLA